MSGGMPAGSGRSARLDPFALPVRFSAADAAADGRSREVELTRERVVVRRAVAGIRMAVNLPISAYRGVAIRTSAEGAAVVLEHRDPGLALELYAAPDGDEVTAEWRTWGQVLGVPMRRARRKKFSRASGRSRSASRSCAAAAATQSSAVGRRS
jgi:hypothetical protein